MGKKIVAWPRLLFIYQYDFGFHLAFNNVGKVYIHTLDLPPEKKDDLNKRLEKWGYKIIKFEDMGWMVIWTLSKMED